MACDTGYKADTNDNICKITVYDIDNPCPPGTFNTGSGAKSIQQCTSCGARK